jgi:hypothetical protein
MAINRSQGIVQKACRRHDKTEVKIKEACEENTYNVTNTARTLHNVAMRLLSLQDKLGMS